MQIKLVPAVLLFLASYFPLAVILLVQDIKAESWALPMCKSSNFQQDCTLPALSNPTLALSFAVVTGTCLLFFAWVMPHLQGRFQLDVEEAATIPNDLINYVFPYVVSFMGLELGSHGKVVGFLLFMSWMFLITYRSGQILMNPLLLAVGWQLYDVKARINGQSRSLKALSRERVVPGDRLQSCLVQGIYVLSKPH